MISRARPRLVTLDVIRFNLTVARNAIVTLAGDEAFRRLIQDDPGRWESLLDHLALTVEPGPGTLASILAALAEAEA